MITDKQIEEVLDQFQFFKVAELYEKLDWQWAGKGIPNALELRECASRLLGDLKERYPKSVSIETGGLKVRAYEDFHNDSNTFSVTVVKLEFIAHTSIA
jgi:hypothetical protein